MIPPMHVIVNSVKGTAAHTPLIPAILARIRIAGNRMIYPRRIDKVNDARAEPIAVKKRINNKFNALKKTLVK